MAALSLRGMRFLQATFSAYIESIGQVGGVDPDLE
jgi:hypothetical protein